MAGFGMYVVGKIPVLNWALYPPSLPRGGRTGCPVGVVEHPPPRMSRSVPASPAAASPVRPSTSFASPPGATFQAPGINS